MNLLSYKEQRLRKVTKCPQCGSYRQEFWRSEEFEPTEERDVFTGTSPNTFTPNGDDKAAARFWCGLELSINESNEIICRIPCRDASKEAAEDLNREIEDDFEAEDFEGEEEAA
ncbi:hypothetical protein G6M16_007580 [Agrobacterium tumefaciens]|nr:hypothetical protein G6M16_007580 [Agrobacterium tumefaciens]